MNDTLLLAIGAIVFGLMLAGLVFTVVEFRRMPRRQKPQFEDVAWQAQPEKPGKDNHGEGRP